MNNRDKLKELRMSAYDAKVVLSKATTTALNAAREYCSCTIEVFNASDNAAYKSIDDEIIYACRDDWASCEEASQFLSSAQDFAEETSDITK